MEDRNTKRNISTLLALLVASAMLTLTLVDDFFAEDVITCMLIAIAGQVLGGLHMLACWGISKALDTQLGTAREHTLRLANTNGAMHGALSMHDQGDDELEGALSVSTTGMLTIQ